MGKIRDTVHYPVRSPFISSRPEADSLVEDCENHTAGQEAPTSQPILTFASVPRRDREGVRDAQMRSSLLPRSARQLPDRDEAPCAIPTPYRLLWARPSETTTRAGRPGGNATKRCTDCGVRKLQPRRAAITTDPCSEFTQRASTASSSSMQSRPSGIEAIGHNFARHGLRACSSPVSASLQTRCAAT